MTITTQDILTAEKQGGRKNKPRPKMDQSVRAKLEKAAEIADAKIEALEKEWGQRGTELMGVMKLHGLFRNQIPQTCNEQMQAIFDGFNERNQEPTVKKANEIQKRKKNAKNTDNNSNSNQPGTSRL